MKQRTAANRMNGSGDRSGATLAKTWAPPPAGSEVKRDDDDRNGRSRRRFRRRVPQHQRPMSVSDAESMRGVGLGPPGRYWEGTPISTVVKRLIEIVVAATVLLLLAPLVGLLALAIVLESPGGVFYRAERVGFRGKPLRMLKFRKMRREAVGGPLTANGDGRLTRVGAVLTRTRLDELPQFWHVLCGEMSLVGPRPEDPLFVRCRPDDFADILKVRPGISGFSQLAFADEPRILSRDDPVGDYVHRILPQKCALDRLYVWRGTLRMDARIAFWTVVAVLLRQPVAVHRGTGAMSLRRRRSGTSPVWMDLREPGEVVADHGPSRAAMIAATT
jgi:lipopolysaccharide/colanic/teichoic acid biosynthesis glycosyltransferase